ncbi:glycosyltransferase family 39 protein [Flavobacterium sedimenticola]|uniref:Glycosyltransferase family 39 protein n=1 Tax=Flavobacterium sedimenticola TaxID=3043286 RepID=A0ABT6XLZ3_9FLAO|nr:glycosyltransferase family 39 protein [Flavobacterium sedimenticola]MDI9256109.1 glycosyltransferase family 39 protein [Flavobacterium sedimenticola]
MKIIEFNKVNKLLILILLLGSIFRFYKIDFQSIWLDEIHSINESNPNIRLLDLYSVIMSGEQMPPLYFYSLYFLFKIFGYTTFVARMYSAIVGILSIYAIYLLGKEMINTKVGLIVAFLVAINPFHLYFSQEVRPYIFLFLFTTLAFYYLVKFLKTPKRENALLYGLLAALMLYSHFFGLFVLFAQYLILLLFLILSNKENRKNFFINSFISGILTLVLFTPAIKILIKVSEIKEFWIPAPTPEVYTLIFKEFFGSSEMILTILGLLVVLYFVRLASLNDTLNITYESVISDKKVFSFVIIVIWISVVLLIPLIRSYLSIPMIVNRYFIALLPGVLILLSISISQIKNKIVQITVVSLLLVFSATDTLIVKKYYSVPNKAQFREATVFIKTNSKGKEPVVTSLGWYMPFFFKNDKAKFEIVDKSLDAYLAEMQQDTTKIKPFWYIDGHDRVYNPSEKSLAFLNEHFYIENNYDGFQAWTKHFILLKDVPKTIDISKFKKMEEVNGDPFKFNLETYQYADNKLTLTGWAYFDNQDAKKTEINLILVKDRKAIRLQTQRVIRKDVTEYFKSNFDLDDSGFSVNADTSLEPGHYKVAIYMVNRETGKEGLTLTDKTIVK